MVLTCPVSAAPALTPPRGPPPEAHRPQLAPRLTTQTSPPFRHATRDSAQQTPLSARAMHVGCRVSSTTPVRHAWHHAYLGPLTPQPDGYLPLEQFNECGALPNRFSRAPHSWKVSSRGGVAAEVSGGREDGAAGGTGQGEQTGTGRGTRLVLAGRRSASCRVRRRMGRAATLKTPRLRRA